MGFDQDNKLNSNFLEIKENSSERKKNKQKGKKFERKIGSDHTHPL